MSSSNSDIERYAYSFCLVNSNTSELACQSTAIKYLALFCIFSNISAVAIIAAFLPRSKVAITAPINIIKNTTFWSVWILTVSLFCRAFAYLLIFLEIGSPTTPDQIFYSSLFMDSFFYATVFSSASNIKGYLACYDILAKQKLIMQEAAASKSKSSASISLSEDMLAASSAPAPETPISSFLGSVKMTRMAYAWVLLTVLFTMPFSIFAAISPYKATFNTYRRIKFIIFGCMYVAAAGLVYVLNMQFEDAVKNHEQNLKEERAAKHQKRLELSKKHKLNPNNPASSTVVVPDSEILTGKGLFNERSKAIYRVGMTNFSLLVGAAPSMIFTGGILDIILEKSLTYNIVLTVLDFISILAMLQFCLAYWSKEKSATESSDDTLWTLAPTASPKKEASANHNLRDFSNVSQFK